MHFNQVNMLLLNSIVALVLPFGSGEHIYNSYQRSISCSTKYPAQYPVSILEIQNIVHDAKLFNVHVKAIGSKHSISDSICTSGIPVYTERITHFIFNHSTKSVTVGAGMELHEFMERLHNLQRTISGIPEYGGISIGGAIANGAHGTGLKNSNTLSESLLSVTFVDGRGNVRKVLKGEPHFQALQVNLGLLGIIYQAEFQTVSQYKLHIQHFPVSDNIIRNGTSLENMARQHDRFEFWWFPTNRQVVLGIGTEVSVSNEGNCSNKLFRNFNSLTKRSLSRTIELIQKTNNHLAMFYMQTIAKLSLHRDILLAEPMFVDPDGRSPCLERSVGYSHKMVTSTCEECFWHDNSNGSNDDSEIAIPLKNLIPALRKLSDLFETLLVQFPSSGIRVRIMPPGSAFMGANEGNQEWAAIGWSTFQRWDLSQPKLYGPVYQAISQILVCS